MSIKAVEDAIGHIETQVDKIEQDNTEGKPYPINEWPTRYILIDPVLLALGWNIHDYAQCEIEPPMPSGQWKRKADYVLYKPNGSAIVVIEAKCFQYDLGNPSGVEQLANYAHEFREGVGVMTNGTEWHLYSLNRYTDFTRKQVKKVNLLDGNRIDKAKMLHEQLNAKQFGW